MPFYKIYGSKNEEETCLVECICNDMDHSIRFSYDKTDPWPELWMSYKPDFYVGFFRRIWWAIKFIFGIRTKKWETTGMYPEEAKGLMEFLMEYIFHATQKMAKANLKATEMWLSVVTSEEERRLEEAKNAISRDDEGRDRQGDEESQGG